MTHAVAVGGKLRFDVIEFNGLWLVTDSRGAPRFFTTPSEALAAAHAEAAGASDPVEIYLWRDGTSVRVHPPAED